MNKKRALVILLAAIIAVALAGLFMSLRRAARQRDQVARLVAEQNALSALRPTARASRGPRSRDAALKDPQAREALIYAGADPKATEIWAVAINNPDLPANERKDLIEDLNEEGFADPKNLTAEDLPLILSRIELIEMMAPTAMDQVNADAFQEAHKDLVNMRDRIGRQPSKASNGARP